MELFAKKWHEALLGRRDGAGDEDTGRLSIWKPWGLSDGFREQWLAAGEESEKYVWWLASYPDTRLRDAAVRRNEKFPPLAVAPRP